MTVPFAHLLRQRKVVIVAAVLLVSTAAIYGLVHLTSRPAKIPAFEVTREEFVDSLQFRGEVKATRSLTLSAPAGAGELRFFSG